MDNGKVFAMKLAKIYPLLVQKAVRKGRAQQEVDAVIEWLTGHTAESVQALIRRDADYRAFFEEAPAMNPNRALIKGVVCGVRVEAIEDPLMRDVRYLDKLVDELAKGKPLEKILRV